MKRVIHKTCPTWGVTQCGRYLFTCVLQGIRDTSYRWRDVTCKTCLRAKPEKEAKP